MTRTSPTISIADVARHADVSIGTVSRIFNHHPAVSADLRRRVLLSSRSLGFVPKVAHRCVAVVTGRRSPALPTGYVSIMTSLLSQLLAAERYLVELIDVESLDLAYETHLNGVIGIVFDERLAELANIPNLPVVSINKPMMDRNVASVYADHYQQGYIATRHLLERGHREIGFLAIEPDEWGSAERLRGCRDALAESGITLDPARAQYSTLHPAYDILSRWRQRGVTGILNFSEDVCLEVIHILSNVFGLTLGKDISTVTIEDLPIYGYLSPPQTVVCQPLEQLARVAVDHVLHASDANGSSTCLDCCLPTKLIERDSVADFT